MKKLFNQLLFISLLCLMSCDVDEKTETPDEPVLQLIERVVPGMSEHFIIEQLPENKSVDAFEIEGRDDKIILRGNNNNSLAVAFNYYLEDFCNCQYSQAGIQLDVSQFLPVPEEKITKSSDFELRYYLNYCTYNYTMSFWSWEDWERELDWMAMQGVNMALSATGMEEVWQNVLKRLKFSDEEISKFIPGPAYQAWWLMGNLEGWGGPVSQEWIKRQTDLQKKILKRMNELGIEPLFHGFYGVVPRSMKNKFPNVHIIEGGNWCNYYRPDFLDPTDPFFNEVAGIYYEELEKLYGKTRFYGGDPFHEGGNTEGIDITKSATIIQDQMLKANPEATWVLQGWIENPSEVLLDGVDKEKILVLDLFNDGLLTDDSQAAWEVTDAFHGSPWVWCVIQNFGGRNGLYGKLDYITANLRRAQKSEHASKLKGIGLMPEANRLNPLMMQYIFGLAWEENIPEPAERLQQLVISRYYKEVVNALQAWSILGKSVFNIPPRMSRDEPQPIYCARPTLEIKSAAPWGSTQILYQQKSLVEACNLLLKAADELKDKDTYRYDIVDLVRQCFYQEAKDKHGELAKLVEGKKYKEAVLINDEIIEMIDDIDRLLSTREEFLLGKWIADARSIAPTEAEKDLFEENARMLITIWGQDTENVLLDYAHREWAGLMKDFYGGRWKLYGEYLDKKANGENPDEINFFEWETEWTKKKNKFKSEPEGDEIEIAKELFTKYFN